MMSVDTSAVRDEVEEMQERERIAWRVSCRRAREQAKERELEVGKGPSSYTEVVATVGRGAVGDGRQSAHGWRRGEEVCSSNVLLDFKLVFNFSPIVLETMGWCASLTSLTGSMEKTVGVVQAKWEHSLKTVFPLVRGMRRRR